MEISTSPATATANSSRLGEDDRFKPEEGDRFSIGNRWPRQETLALLEIRSEMDTAFREAGLKAPLWEEVSRKLSELGYNRSAKKCKEKFENVYKYHRRTKEGRSGKVNGKSYRFFEQLEALDSNQGLLSSFSPDKVSIPMAAATVNPANVVINAVPTSIHTPSVNFTDNPSTSATSSSSEESEGTRKKKRKLTQFFERLMKEVIEKQESLQKKFLDAIEKCEQDRMAREEAWKMQELDRIKKERELLLEERSIAAAKDAAVLSFLQKLSEQNSSVQLPENQVFPAQMAEQQIVPVEKVVKEQEKENNNLESFVNMSSSRWPKEEIETLIKLRTNLDMQYQDNGPKGPLWEEVSAAMKKHGYNRSSKRCKEKWENMNKYFKRVRENNKRRPDDAKTCPYFHQLDALYREKKTRKLDNSGKELKPEELLMHMMGGQEERQRQESVTTEDCESENADQNQEEEDDRENDEEDEYRVVASDPSSVAIMDRLEMH
ncbi:trihelix transcription factor DF1-like [Euphorbia lathyris]|uniref:trihelix transcription factor DF1-like n=1 Tax=Euphorbia lathyris TaxID=212925 RepID=UPI00331405B3